jgi:hypothetical protein
MRQGLDGPAAAVRADWRLNFPDALEVCLDRVYPHHALKPYPILGRCAAQDNFGHSTAFLTVKKVGHKNCGTLRTARRTKDPATSSEILFLFSIFEITYKIISHTKK